MASINQVPEVLNDFRVYEEGSDNCLGVAKVELPSESVMTQTVKGVGIAGEVEAPVIGHYSSMETKLLGTLQQKLHTALQVAVAYA